MGGKESKKAIVRKLKAKVCCERGEYRQSINDGEAAMVQSGMRRGGFSAFLSSFQQNHECRLGRSHNLLPGCSPARRRGRRLNGYYCADGGCPSAPGFSDALGLLVKPEVRPRRRIGYDV